VDDEDLKLITLATGSRAWRWPPMARPSATRPCRTYSSRTVTSLSLKVTSLQLPSPWPASSVPSTSNRRHRDGSAPVAADLTRCRRPRPAAKIFVAAPPVSSATRWPREGPREGR